MGFSFGGMPCLDPMTLWNSCRDLRLPVEPWFGRANFFSYGRGMRAGRGYLLMRRGDFSQLDMTGQYDLTIAGNIGTTTFKNLVIVSSQVVTPSFRGAPDVAVFVEIADRRYLYERFSPQADNFYNLLDFTSEYIPAYLNSGSPWTWDEMVEDLWDTVGTDFLGDYPGLPFTPDGVPTNIRYESVSAWSALGDVLLRLACSLQLDPTTDTFSIVQIGATDTTETNAESRWDNLRTWDKEPQESAQGWFPENVRVKFRLNPPLTDPESDAVENFYVVDVSITDVMVTPPTGYTAGTYVTIEDDLVAMVTDETGTVYNTSDLASRALERATDWYRVRQVGYNQMHRVYADVISDTGFIPGSQLNQMAVYDRGTGLKTEVVRRDGPVLEGWRSFPLTVPVPGVVIRAIITGPPTDGAYPWKQVVPLPGGLWGFPANPRGGSVDLNAAYEENDNTALGEGTVVLLRPGAVNLSDPDVRNQEYVFEHCCSGGSASGSGSLSGSGPFG